MHKSEIMQIYTCVKKMLRYIHARAEICETRVSNIRLKDERPRCNAVQPINATSGRRRNGLSFCFQLIYFYSLWIITDELKMYFSCAIIN